ncbi:MAG: hypothetical protein ACR2PY_05500 [Salinispira sp.]
MKRFSLILITLVLFGGAFVSAQEYAPSISIDGKVDLIFDFDLGETELNIENVVETNLILEFVPEGDAMMMDGDGVYGVIKLENFGISLDSDNIEEVADISLSGGDPDTYYFLKESLIKEPDVTASIYLIGEMFYITVTSDAVETDFTPAIFLDAIGDVDDGAGGVENPLHPADNDDEPTFFDGGVEGSITVGTNNDILDASLILGDHDADGSGDLGHDGYDEEEANALDILLKLSLDAVENLTLEAGIGLNAIGVKEEDAVAQEQAIAFGAKAGYNFADLGLPLDFSVSFDGKQPFGEDADFELELGLTLDLDLLGGEIGVAFATNLTNHAFLLGANTGELLPFVLDAGFELGVMGEDDLAYGASAGTDLAITGGFKVPLGFIEPYGNMKLASIGTSSTVKGEDGDDALKLAGNVGVKLINVIENVDFDLKLDAGYNTLNLPDAPLDAAIKFTTTIKY